jgi:uncharacterized UBP type Zn finger protein
MFIPETYSIVHPIKLKDEFAIATTSSHYVSYLKVIINQETKWCFFDDRKTKATILDESAFQKKMQDPKLHHQVYVSYI